MIRSFVPTQRKGVVEICGDKPSYLQKPKSWHQNVSRGESEDPTSHGPLSLVRCKEESEVLTTARKLIDNKERKSR